MQEHLNYVNAPPVETMYIISALSMVFARRALASGNEGLAGQLAARGRWFKAAGDLSHEGKLETKAEQIVHGSYIIGAQMEV